MNIEKFLLDIRDEPDWRYEADHAAEYYDGNQLSSDALQFMQSLGLAPLIRNLIGPTIDVILGMQAKNKRDWRVSADEEPDTDMAKAMTRKLRDAERTSDADTALSCAYGDQIKAGLGWVEVQRELDPFRSPYRVKAIGRREMFWDWRSRDPDLHDARYLVRRKWYDMDQLAAFFPEHAELIENAMTGWAKWDFAPYTEPTLDLARRFDEHHRTSLEAREWQDTERKRLALYEVWYRVYQRGQVLRLPGNYVIEYDPNNPQHRALTLAQMVQPEDTTLTKVRLAWWLGPHPLYDIASPYPHNHFPYVPFFGYREDATGIPYGLIRRMMSPQDEVNARLSKMMWLLSAKRVIMDEDAVEGTMSIGQVQQEAARPDAHFVLNKSRRYQDALKIDTDRDMSIQQFNVLKDAQVAIQDTSGIYQAMLGKESTADSGVAIANLVEQGSTTLARINDNFSRAKAFVGELLLSLVKQDIGREPLRVFVEQHGAKVPVIVNEVQVDPAGYTYRSNDIMRTRTRVALEETPSTPTYRNLLLTQMTELVKSLPPELQPLVIDLVVKLTDLPDKEEMMARIRQATGQGPKTPEQQQQEQQATLLERTAQQLELKQMAAKVGESNARIEKMMAEIQRILAETRNKEQDLHLKEDQAALDIDRRLDESAQQAAMQRANAAASRPKPKSKA